MCCQHPNGRYVLNESERDGDRFAELVNNLDGIVWEADAETWRFLFVSAQAERILGYPCERWYDDPSFWPDRIHPEDRTWALEYCSATTARLEPHSFEYRMIAADGRVVWLHDLVTVTAVDGRPKRLRGVMVDITARKEAERAFRESEQERRHLEAQILHAQKLESLGVMAGGLAHDFNNLLTAVLGNAGLALMHLPAESIVAPMLREIEQAARRAAELTQQMLAYSGRGRFFVETIRLDAVVREMTMLLGSVISKKAAIDLRLDATTISADATQVRQIVMNLITNASDALGDRSGTIVIRTSVEALDEAALRSPFLGVDTGPGHYVVLEVQDSGCGMSAETVSRIFDPFFTTKFAGRGLGLAAVLGIVRGHRGTIQVSSEPGRGTRFRVLFPAATMGAVDTGDHVFAPSSGRVTGTVLIVDDEPAVRRLGQLVLESVGFRVITADDGRAGLDAFLRHADELTAAVVDLTMPHMDGPELAGHIQATAPGLPVLLMSGYSEHEVTARLSGRDVSDFIQKPFSPREFIARVLGALGPAR